MAVSYTHLDVYKRQAPGKVCVYERNVVTNDELYKAGIELCVVPSEELSRGRGGPRCMSMPFARADI